MSLLLRRTAAATAAATARGAVPIAASLLRSQATATAEAALQHKQQHLPPLAPALHVVLWRPAIAGNVGAALRTARGFGAALHVIEPRVDVSGRAAARAAVGYSRRAAGGGGDADDAAAVATEAYVYHSLHDYLARGAPGMTATVIVSKGAKYGRCELHEWAAPGPRHGCRSVALLFGNESTGVDALYPALAEAGECGHLRASAEALSAAPTVAIPMAPGMRSHNLAVSVGIVLWEATRQQLAGAAARRLC